MSSLTPYTYINGFKSREFHHAVLSISGTTHTLYLDGNVVQTNTNAPDILNTFSSVNQTVIGANYLFNQAFNGIIGDVRVYNKAISDTQVSNLYLNRNLIAHYPFDISVNKLTPNYATLQYDASFVGSATTITYSTLNINNSTTAAASQYIIAKPGNGQWYLNSSTGITISCWINANSTRNTNQIMRIFDIPLFSGSKGVSVDISGTNAIYSSSYLTYTAQLFFPFTDNSNNYGRYSSFSSSNVITKDPSGLIFSSILNKKCSFIPVDISGIYNTGLFNNGYTISAWFYITYSLNAQNRTTYDLNIYNVVGPTWSISDINVENSNYLASILMYLYNPPYFSINLFDTRLPRQNAWYHFACTTKGSTDFEHYINGINVGSIYNDIRGDFSIWSDNLKKLNIIKLCRTSQTNRDKIAYRYLTVFNSTFSQSQIIQLYNEQSKM